MTEKPIHNPTIPYLGPLRTVIAPGSFIRIIGTVSSLGKEFFCNLQCGPNNYEDVALHISVNLNDGTIVTKAQEFGSWVEENVYVNSLITQGDQFEILLLIEFNVLKIGVNGQHLCEFPHKIQYHRISYIKIEGDLTVSLISVEKQPSTPISVDKAAEMSAPPPPYGLTTSPYPPAPQGAYPSGMPPQGVAPQPLNSGYAPQTVVYTNPPPSNVYAYNAIPQQGVPIGALNANSRSYNRPFFSRPYYGNRKMMYISFAVFGVFTLISLTVFLIVFFKGQSDFNEASKRNQERFNNNRW